MNPAWRPRPCVVVLALCQLAAAAGDCCPPASVRLTRQLEKDGFHRQLVTSARLAWPPCLAGCRLLLLERLPAGVFVDPYQVAREQRGRHRLLGPAHVEAMAHDASGLDVLSWAEVNHTQAAARVSLPVHARYHRADETERLAAVYIESPRVFVACDWESQEWPAAEAAGAGGRETLPCRAAGDAVCEYRAVPADNSPAVVLQVPLGDLRDLELVLVGTAVAVTAGTVLLLLVISNKGLDSPRQR